MFSQSKKYNSDFKKAEKIILRDPDKAYSLYVTAIKECKNDSDFENLAWAYIELARFYSKTNDPEKMLSTLLNAKPHVLESNDSILNFSFQHELTVCYRNLLKFSALIRQAKIENQVAAELNNDSIKLLAKSTLLMNEMAIDTNDLTLFLPRIKELELFSKGFTSLYYRGLIKSLYGMYYGFQGKYNEALIENENAIKFYKQINDTSKLCSSYRTRANFYFEMEDYANSILFYKKAFELCVQYKNYFYASDNATDIAYCYGLKNDFGNTDKYASIAEKYFSQTLSYVDDNYCYTWLAEIYEKIGNSKKSSFYYKKLGEIKDKLIVNSDADNLMTVEAELTNNFKLSNQKKEFEREKQIKENEKKYQTRLKNIFIVGFIIVAILLFIAYKGYINTKKGKELVQQRKLEIEKQKQIVEEQNKEIRDSINYAQRIQNAILAPQEDIKKGFTDLFIFFKPKDVVSGDFYWYKNIDDKNYIAAADCTGHGVPGAIVSVICSNSLNSAVGEYNKTTPGEILDTTKKIVVDTLAKNNNNVMDGMDISFLSVDYSKNEVQWAGAYNPLWIIDSKNNLVEIKADKQSIGKSDTTAAFTTHTLTVDKGSMLYLITDGYADQFGGENGKKFKYQQLKNLLISNSAKSCEAQKQALEEAFVKWQGELEQVDDVTIIGIRI